MLYRKPASSGFLPVFFPLPILSLISLVMTLACSPDKDGSNYRSSIDVNLQETIYLKLKTGLANGDIPVKYNLRLPPGTPDFPDNPQNPLTSAGRELGRWLFYDPITSGNGEMSCSSCHRQELAFTDGKKESPGIHGETVGRNSMSLVNLAWGRAFFWDGRVDSLEKQATMPIENKKELDLPLSRLIGRLKAHPVYPRMFVLAFSDDPEISEQNIGRALAQFMRSLVSFGADLDQVRRVEIGVTPTENVKAELLKFHPDNIDPETRAAINLCGNCHSGANYGDPRVFGALYGGTRLASNGLDADPEPAYGEVTGRKHDQGKFKIPSLRNVEVTAPYMHDGRFATLEKVLDHYSLHIQDAPNLDPALKKKGKPERFEFSPRVRKNIITYLKLMTDPSFTTDERFSNPFRKTETTLITE